MIDLDLIQKGRRYDELNRSIIIFICTFDYYKMNQYKYTFTNKCLENNQLEYGDETVKIVINTKGTKGYISDDLKDFLNCINGYFSSSEFSDTLKSEMEKVKRSEKFRREFMTLYLHDEEIKRKSIEKGILLQTIKYYKKERISLEEAIEDTGLSEEEFLRKMKEFEEEKLNYV